MQNTHAEGSIIPKNCNLTKIALTNKMKKSNEKITAEVLPKNTSNLLLYPCPANARAMLLRASPNIPATSMISPINFDTKISIKRYLLCELISKDIFKINFPKTFII